MERENREHVGWLEIDPATVGKPARVYWRLQGHGAGTKRSAVLSLAITHVEKGQTVFAVDKIPVAGEYLMNFQFIDGADYRVTANAEMPDGELVRTEQVVAVTAVEPPMAAMMPAIGFFLTAIAVGLSVGRWSRRNATPS